MKPELSDRQREILDFIEEYVAEHQAHPTVREIQKGCRISSTSVVDYNLRKLKGYGEITVEPEVARGIRLTKPVEQELEWLFTISRIGNNPNIEVLGELVVAGANGRPGAVFFRADAETEEAI